MSDSAATGRFQDDCPECGEFECVCRGPDAAQPSRIGSKSDEVKILGETADGYTVDADGWSFESCPSCGTLVGEWLTEDGPDVMLLVECPMCVEASRDEDWWC